MTSFKESQLSEDILRAIQDLGFTEPTEIQKLTIPYILSDTSDLIALAQTGTGKTAAFSLPVLEQIDTQSRQIQLLVLCPTRELCLQIAKDITSYSKYIKGLKVQAVYGGSSIMEQIRGLKEKPQIVVGTPGRVIDLIERKKLFLDTISWVVLDEADEMLSMGFKEDLETILAETPEEKQTLLFSATMNKEVERISKNYLHNPHKIAIKGVNEVKKNITHEYYVVGQRQKKEALRRLLDANPNYYSIIFCRTRAETQDVADYLMQHAYAADALHGDLSQAQRDTVMKKFRLKNINLLVATDVAARGLDVDSLSHVIHYSIPDDPEVFVHRSGRTGRAGKNGISMALVKPEETRKMKQIKAHTKITMQEKNIPAGKEIIHAQIQDFWNQVFQTHENFFDFDKSQLPDLSEISKEELAVQLMQLHLKDLAQHYTAHPEMKKAEPVTERSRPDRQERRRGKKNTSKNMTRFFFNMGKRDGLKKTDVLQIINKATKKSRRTADIGDIEILDKFSFFEVENDFKREILHEIPHQSFKGKKLRAEVAE